MVRAGFVLVGGKSSRMGENKAFLRFPGGFPQPTLLDRVASAVESAAGNVSLVGDPGIYGGLGFPVVPDIVPGAGPLSGICSAVGAGAEWNLIVACDMPALSVDLLTRLFSEAAENNPDCVIPAGRSGRLEPLCAVYHRRCFPRLQAALMGGVRKVTDALTDLRVRQAPVSDGSLENGENAENVFENLNTPEDWNRFVAAASNG